MPPLIIFIIAALVSFLLTIPTIKFANKFSLVTNKRKRQHPAHTHKGIIPRGGGLPIYFAILISAILFLPMSKIIIGILVSSFFLLVIGILDDYYDLSPYLRFGGNILISTLVVTYGLGIPYISNPLGGIIRLDQVVFSINIFGIRNLLILADILAIIWLTWTMNMINWSKGVDGQLPGFVAIAAFFLALISQRFVTHDINVTSVMLLSFIVAGAYLGFLPHNFYPQKIMPGYGGGALAGFLLGILAILSFGKVGTAILILSVPLIDAVYTITRRIINKKSPFRADWGHFHHRLLEIGWGKRRVACFYWVITFILGISSLFFKGIQKLTAFVTTAIILLVFMYIIGKIKKIT